MSLCEFLCEFMLVHVKFLLDTTNTHKLTQGREKHMPGLCGCSHCARHVEESERNSSGCLRADLVHATRPFFPVAASCICRQALQRLTEAAEKAKIELSALPQTSINLPFITATADGPKHIDTTLSRAQFEQLCNDLLERVRRPVEQVREARVFCAHIHPERVGVLHAHTYSMLPPGQPSSICSCVHLPAFLR